MTNDVVVVGLGEVGRPLFELVSEKLEQLPASAWPYGLVVMVSDCGILSSPKDLPQIQADRSELLKALKKHCIAVDLSDTWSLA